MFHSHTALYHPPAPLNNIARQVPGFPKKVAQLSSGRKDLQPLRREFRIVLEISPAPQPDEAADCQECRDDAEANPGTPET